MSNDMDGDYKMDRETNQSLLPLFPCFPCVPWAVLF